MKYLEKGNHLFANSKFEDAIKYYDKAIILNSENIEALYKKGRSLGALQRFEEAIDCLNETLKTDPNYLGALNFKGFYLKQLSLEQESMECFKRAIELNLHPNSVESYLNRGLSLNGLKQFDDSVQCYDKVI